MSRAMSTAALAALSAQETNEVFLYLLEIGVTINGTTDTHYFVNNTVSVERNGTTYDPLSFKIVLPQEGEHINSATINLDVVDREIIEVMRSADEPPTISFILILASNLNGDPEAGPFNFVLKEVSYNKTSLSATLSTGNHLEGTFPKVIRTPYYFPALF